MSLRVGILAERGLPATNYLVDAVNQAGHQPKVIHYPDLTVKSGGDSGISLIGDPESVRVDYIIPYNDAHILVGNRILSALISLGIPSFLQPEKILTARNKLLAQLAFGKAGVRHPASIAVPLDAPQDPLVLGRQLNDLMYEVEPNRRKKVVVKELYGTEGDGVWLHSRPEARSKAAELLRGNVEFMFQKAIPMAPGQRRASDKGIFVCGGKFITAFKRTAEKGEFRANLSKGGTAEPYTPSDEEIEPVLKISDALKLPAGRVDVMDSIDGPSCLEFNVFPGSQIVDITGVEVFKLYVATAIAYYEESREQLESDSRFIV